MQSACPRSLTQGRDPRRPTHPSRHPRPRCPAPKDAPAPPIRVGSSTYHSVVLLPILYPHLARPSHSSNAAQKATKTGNTDRQRNPSSSTFQLSFVHSTRL